MKPDRSAFRIVAAVLTTGTLLAAAYFAAPFIATALAPVLLAKIGYALTVPEVLAGTYGIAFLASLGLAGRAAMAGRPVSALLQSLIAGFAAALFLAGIPAPMNILAVGIMGLTGVACGVGLVSIGFNRASALPQPAPS